MNMHIVIMTSLALGAYAAGHVQGNAKCPCVDAKKAFSKCDQKFSDTCMCKEANKLADGPKKNFNAMAIAAGGAFFSPTYGETCASGYDEIFDNRCADATGKIYDIVCDDKAVPPVTTNCRASWCTAKWCYVDPCNCDSDDVTESNYFAPLDAKLFYSYKTCGAASGYAAAQGAVAGKDKCDAVGKTYGTRAAVAEPENSCPAPPISVPGNAKCPCVDKKKAFVKCNTKLAKDCMCNAGNAKADGPKKNFNKFATALGGAFFYPAYGETCSAYEEIFDKRCADDNGVEFAKVCDDKAVPPVTTNCRASWCSDKWCYVDPCNCDSADVTASTYFADPENKLFYSYKTCGSTDTYSAAQGTKAADNKCDAHGKTFAMRALVAEPADSCPGPELPAEVKSCWGEPASPNVASGAKGCPVPQGSAFSGSEHARMGITTVFAMLMMMQ